MRGGMDVGQSKSFRAALFSGQSEISQGRRRRDRIRKAKLRGLEYTRMGRRITTPVRK